MALIFLLSNFCFQNLIQESYAECVAAILCIYFDILVTVNATNTDLTKLAKLGKEFKAFAIMQLESYPSGIQELLLPDCIQTLQEEDTDISGVAKEVFFPLALYAVALPIAKGVSKRPDMYAKYVAEIHHVQRLYPMRLAKAVQVMWTYMAFFSL